MHDTCTAHTLCCFDTTRRRRRQWRISVVKLGQGQSGQAVKLLQITPDVNAFQTLNFPVPDSQ